MATTTHTTTPNGVKIAGELIVPGASQFIDGNLRSGALHLLGGVASIALFGGAAGVVLSLLVRGNSYTLSTRHRGIISTLTGESTTAAG